MYRKVTVSEADESQQKKQKLFMESFMDHNINENERNSKQLTDEVKRSVELNLDEEMFLNPLNF
jgi:hypothetical protein